MIGGAIEQRRRLPVVCPGMGRLQLRRLVGVTRNDMGMESRLEVAEDGVVDALRSRHLQYRIAETSEVLEEERALVRAEGIETGYDRVREQQRIAAQELPLAEDCPPGEEAGENLRIAAGPGIGHLPVNRRLRCRLGFVLHLN